MQPGIRIIGMDLHREILFGIDEFYQDGEIFIVRSFGADDLAAGLLDVIAERRAGKFTVGYRAEPVVMAGQLPAFSYRI